MAQPPVDPERIAESTARHLLERAAALDSDGSTLVQLRQAALEAGISPEAFDAAVAEWRAAPPPATTTLPGERTSRVLRNLEALAIGFLSVAGLAIAERLVAAPWLVHKASDPLALVIGALIAARLRARPASIVLGGLAVSQGAEFLMDLSAGAPAIHGLGAHAALMIAGVGGVAIGRVLWGRSGPTSGRNSVGTEEKTATPSEEVNTTRGVGMTDAEAERRFLETLRLRRNLQVARLQLS